MEVISLIMANSKEIFERQNMPGLVSAQKAASYCYKDGKKLATALALISIIFPIATNILLLFVDDIVVSSILSVFLFLGFILAEIIRMSLDKAKFNGAGLQQYFDEFVFGLKNSCKKYLVPAKITSSERIRLILKYKDEPDENFSNWYSDYSKLSYEQAVYQCQKENIRWDLAIRKKYKNFLVLLMVLLGVFLIINAILQRMEIVSLITIISSILPLSSYFYNGLKKLSKNIKSQENLYSHIEVIERDLKNQKAILDEIEELQVEIFEYRKKAYLIPDWFYKFYRNKFQTQEDLYAKHISNVDMNRD